MIQLEYADFLVHNIEIKCKRISLNDHKNLTKLSLIAIRSFQKD